MGTIEVREGKDGKPRFRARVRRDGVQLSQTFTRKTDATRWIRSEESDIDEGRLTYKSEARRRTVAQMADKYIEQVVPRKKSQKAPTQMMRWWKSEIGRMKLIQVTPAVVADCRDKLLSSNTYRHRPRAPGTVVRYLATLSHAFSVAEKEWGWVNQNPVRSVKKPNEPPGRVRYLSKSELRALLQACEESTNQYLKSVVLLALTTGMRRGEILNLKWSDIELKDDHITLHTTKNDQPRRVALYAQAKSELLKLKKVRHISSGLLFPARSNPHHPIDIRRPWNNAVTAANLEDFRFHDLRHCTASYMAMSGSSLLDIGNQLGHKTLATTKRYSHLSDEHLREATRRMVDKYIPDA